MSDRTKTLLYLGAILALTVFCAWMEITHPRPRSAKKQEHHYDNSADLIPLMWPPPSQH